MANEYEYGCGHGSGRSFVEGSGDGSGDSAEFVDGCGDGSGYSDGDDLDSGIGWDHDHDPMEF